MRMANTTTGYLYSVRDLRLDVYQVPFAARSDADAVRMLMSLSGRVDSTVLDFPRDYVLYCVGEFDYDTASVRPLDTDEQVCDMSYILRQVQAERQLNGQESLDTEEKCVDTEEKTHGSHC